MGGPNDMVGTHDNLDLAALMRLRLVVARFGEMDNSRWWNTKGLLGQLGELALRRGLPKSHFFAQARVVFAVAADRCRKVFDPPSAITLWRLPTIVEEQLDAQCADWLEQPEEWASFFKRLQNIRVSDLLAVMLDLGVIGERDVANARTLRRAADNRAVPLPGVRQVSTETVKLLAAGFFRGEPGEPAIPYARFEGQG
ncbi:MAG: BrxE family protein [Planctomycetota bacterium]